MAPDVRPERNGWRDEEISRRHRKWGWNCPAVDLDFLMVEYNFGRPIALVEYKHHKANIPHDIGSNKTYSAIAELANSAELPFILAIYWPECWAFRVRPLNQMANRYFQKDNKGNWPIFTEREFVSCLYEMRNMKAEESINLSDLNNGFPPELLDHG